MSEPVQIDIGIIGSGPAGMAAACQAAALGLSAIIFDEQVETGGQIYRGVDSASEQSIALLGPDYARGQDITRQFRASGVPRIGSATVVHVTHDLQLGVDTGGRINLYQCRGLIVATGAIERPFPIPGWTLPGVITAGGTQVLLKNHGLIPDGKIVVAGTGPLAYLIAAQLLAAGSTDLTFLDTTPRRNYFAAMPFLIPALGAGNYLFKGLRLLADINKKATRHIYGITSLSASGPGRVQCVEYKNNRGSKAIDADWLLLHLGVTPNSQLLRAVECAHAWNSQQLSWQPVIDAWGETSRPGIFAAGDAGRIMGADAAPCSGRLAALAIAARIGKINPVERERLAAPLRKELLKHQRIRPFLDRLYRPADALRIPVGDTVVCRCENVSAASIDTATKEGCTGPNQLKFFTRCGMGPCQGRYCGTTVSEMLAKITSTGIQDIGHFRIRQPIKPVRLATLATAAAPAKKSETYQV